MSCSTSRTHPPDNCFFYFKVSMCSKDRCVIDVICRGPLVWEVIGLVGTSSAFCMACRTTDTQQHSYTVELCDGLSKDECHSIPFVIYKLGYVPIVFAVTWPVLVVKSRKRVSE